VEVCGAALWAVPGPARAYQGLSRPAKAGLHSFSPFFSSTATAEKARAAGYRVEAETFILSVGPTRGALVARFARRAAVPADDGGRAAAKEALHGLHAQWLAYLVVLITALYEPLERGAVEVGTVMITEAFAGTHARLFLAVCRVLGAPHTPNVRRAKQRPAQRREVRRPTRSVPAAGVFRPSSQLSKNKLPFSLVFGPTWPGRPCRAWQALFVLAKGCHRRNLRKRR
jgi:hypothetical protein